MVGLSGASEDYLKAIYHIAHRGEAVTTGLLAAELGVASPSVTAMIKRLQEGELVDRAGPRELRLTGAGERAALRVVRRHRLLETFLARVLDVPWDEVHAEAEVLEHALSEELEELIAAKLGNPTVDPHGDPIPSRELKLAETPLPSLAELEPGETATFVRISDTDPDMLRFLGERGIVPGTRLKLVEQQPFDGPLFVKAGRETHVLGATLARAMHVEPA